MKATGLLLLLITAMLWGLAFVAQTTASDAVQPFTFNFSRNFVGALFLCGVIGWRGRTGQDKPPTSDGDGGYSRRTLIVGGIACGVLLCAFSFLQQAGITSYPPEAAASGRSGFVTATYMVMVAVMGVFLGKKPHPVVFLSVLVALAGMYLLCVPDGLGDVYVGDWLTLACAFGCALHIIVIDRYTQVDGVRLSRVQLITAGTLSLLGAIVFEQPTLAMVLSAAVPILYAGICSDGVAYTLQIVAQKTTDPTVASIIMSLEAVFAALGGWLILSESLSGVEALGCALVFAAVLLAQAPQLMRREPAKGQA